MDRATIWDKANSCAEAWRARYGTDPAQHAHAIMLVMSVALHETDLGQAWSGSGNWGAIQRRAMTEHERSLARGGITPQPTDAFEQLHGDSSPVTGKYQVWFWAFPAGVATPKGQAGDVAGADKLLEVLLDERHAISAAIDTISPEGLAAMMYGSHYYEGFHDPRALYRRVGQTWVQLQPGETPAPGDEIATGAQLNVEGYAGALEKGFAQIRGALVGWSPGAEPPAVTEPATPAAPSTDPRDRDGVRALQVALNAAGTLPQLAVDGLLGPLTKGALTAFQAGHGLDADGVLGPETLAALRAAAGG